MQIFSDTNERNARCRILLKGQMRYIPGFSGVAFICTPLISGLEELEGLGLYLNDLSMYDSSRDITVAGYQHASRLECSIELVNLCS